VDSKVELTVVDKDGDLKNGVGIEMNKFSFIVMKEVAEKIVGGGLNPH
jgi:hypothetical protein